MCRAYDTPSEDLLQAIQVLARYVYVLEDPGDKRAPLKPALAANVQWLPDAFVSSCLLPSPDCCQAWLAEARLELNFQ